MALQGKNRTFVKTALKNQNRLYPRLSMSMRFLSLPLTDIPAEIAREAEENPFLEIQTDEFLYQREDYSSSGNSDERMWENLGDTNISIFSDLNAQIDLLSPDDVSREILELIISSLDEQGFSKVTTAELMEYGYTKKEIKRSREILRNLEPVGVGSENMMEGLVWQAEKKFPHDRETLDVLHFLNSHIDFMGNPEEDKDSFHEEDMKGYIREHLHIPEKQLTEILGKIKSLYPFPLESREQTERYIHPDIIFHEDHNGVRIEISGSTLLDVYINEDLMQTVTPSLAGDEKKIWMEKYQKALLIRDALAYRKSSLLRIARFIVKRQPEFFRKGAGALDPMNLKEASEELKLHISSISRIVSHKYCQTRWGVHPLKIFFPHGIKTREGLISIGRIKEMITEIIQGEDTATPFSDEQIAEIMTKNGVLIRRRTVAKYRNLLHMPSAFKRKAIKN